MEDKKNVEELFVCETLGFILDKLYPLKDELWKDNKIGEIISNIKLKNMNMLDLDEVLQRIYKED